MVLSLLHFICLLFSATFLFSLPMTFPSICAIARLSSKGSPKIPPQIAHLISFTARNFSAGVGETFFHFSASFAISSVSFHRESEIRLQKVRRMSLKNREGVCISFQKESRNSVERRAMAHVSFFSCPFIYNW